MPAAAPARRRHVRNGIAPIASLFTMLLMASAATRLDAEVVTRAEPILQHMLDATGGSAAREAEHTLHYRGHLVSGGLDGRWDLWLAAPDRWMRKITLGPLRFHEGFDGTVAWRTDLADKTVIPMSTAETAYARQDGWFLNERWALPDQGGGSIRFLSTSYGVGTTTDILEIRPPAGTARRVAVNQKSGFIEREVVEIDSRTFENRPTDYKMLGGRNRASAFESPTLLATDKPIERMTVDSVWVNPTLDSALFSPPVSTARPIAWQRAAGRVRVPFAYGSKTVLIKASINGAPPADFILDTGASLSVLDRDYAFSLGLVAEGQASVEGIAATASMRFARVGSISLAGARSSSATLRDFRVALVDLGEYSDVILWRKPAGLIGADFLSRFVVTIDYDSLAVTLQDPARFAYTGTGAGIPFELHDGIPVVDMTLDDGCSGKFLVDVGNSFHFVVHGSMVRSCRMFEDRTRHEVEVVGGGIGGGFISTLCRLDSVRIGPYHWTEPVAALALSTQGGIGSHDISGNIGNTVLERFRCTFDYANRVLYLQPGRRYGERDRVSRFGALFARLGTRVLAGNVLTGSAAYEAGLHWFDEIVAVDGKPLATWTREDIDRLLEEGEVGSVHRVTYQRMDDPEKTIEVTLKDVL